jgi:branched-subunit amino acid aminotransferase/4-amino-4-deoxychorismate lyase
MSDIVLVPPGETTPVDPASSAFAHGFGLFETMRLADRRLDFWRDHWTRLSRSAQYFALRLPEEAAVIEALRTYVADAELREATLKLSLLKEASGSRLYLYARPPLPEPENRRLRFDASCPVFAGSALAGHKTHNYMEAMYLLGQARARGDYDLLRVDTEGYLAETTTANFFFIKDDRLHTPSLAGGILPGVTRAALIRSPELAIDEGRHLPEVLPGAEAVFLTNATGGVIPIKQITGLPGGRSADYALDGPHIERVCSAFARIRAECAREL